MRNVTTSRGPVIATRNRLSAKGGTVSPDFLRKITASAHIKAASSEKNSPISIWDYLTATSAVQYAV
jgi:hypothetical protein